MSVATEKKMKELRIAWVSRMDGSLRLAWVDESLFVRRVRVEVGCYGR
jgi:hypothetical protein